MKKIIIILLILIVLFIICKFFIDNFDGTGNNGIISSPMDRTKLYGSLFLDNLDKVILNMTDPEIKYDNKRIQVVRYSDILL
jgi:hypothetical protein